MTVLFGSPSDDPSVSAQGLQAKGRHSASGKVFFMKFGAFAPMLACLILAACEAPSEPLASTRVSNVVANVKPGVVTVDFHLVNELGEQIRYGTLWYDRGRRDWYKAQEKCVDGHRTWDTFIDFHHPGPPDVAVEAMLFYKTDCREARVISDIELTNLHVKDGRALVEGRVKRKPDGGIELCVGEPHYIRPLCYEIERPFAKFTSRSRFHPGRVLGLW